MDESQIYAQLTRIFRDIFDDDGLVIGPGTSASDVQGWDSFNHVNIIVATEMEFGVKFRTSEIEELKNVGQFVGLIQRKLGSTATA